LKRHPEIDLKGLYYDKFSMTEIACLMIPSGLFSDYSEQGTFESQKSNKNKKNKKKKRKQAKASKKKNRR
jgi:hypothetical protein